MSASLSNPSRINPHRRLLLLGSASAAAAASVGMPVMAAPDKDSAGVDVFIELSAVPDQVQIRPGTPTRVWRYQSKLLRGDAGALEASAGGYWFHPHPHGRTGKQVYAGLAGLFLISDDEEAALALPSGAQDLPLVIQDRTIDDNNQFVYLDRFTDHLGLFLYHCHMLEHEDTGLMRNYRVVA